MKKLVSEFTNYLKEKYGETYVVFHFCFPINLHASFGILVKRFELGELKHSIETSSQI